MLRRHVNEHVADGVELEDGTAVVRWLGEWPVTETHERGMESVGRHEAASGARVVYVDDRNGVPFRFPGERYHPQRISEDRP